MSKEEMRDNLELALAMLRDWIDSEDEWEKCDLSPNDKEACYEFIEAVYDELKRNIFKRFCYWLLSKRVAWGDPVVKPFDKWLYKNS